MKHMFAWHIEIKNLRISLRTLISSILLVNAIRKCKLYRFDSDAGEWKERGVGQTRLLKSNENGKIRLLMRQEKTLKIRANHFGEL